MRSRSLAPAAAAILTALGVNAVPAAGFFLADWSAATTMFVYLLENLALVALTAARLWWLAGERGETFQGFLITGLGFSAGAAVFMAGMLLLIFKIPLSAAQLIAGLAGTGLFLLLGLVADIIFARGAPRAQAEAWVRHALGRVFLLYLAVFMGMVGALFGAQAGFLMPFIGLKALVDVGEPIEALIRRRA